MLGITELTKAVNHHTMAVNRQTFILSQLTSLLKRIVGPINPIGTFTVLSMEEITVASVVKIKHTLKLPPFDPTKEGADDIEKGVLTPNVDGVDVEPIQVAKDAETAEYVSAKGVQVGFSFAYLDEEDGVLSQTPLVIAPYLAADTSPIPSPEGEFSVQGMTEVTVEE